LFIEICGGNPDISPLFVHRNLWRYGDNSSDSGGLAVLAWVCNHSIAEIVGSCPAECMDDHLFCFLCR
jgi:hypothetical protein